jgi:hypothetical protein
MLSEANVKVARQNYAKLHAYVMEHNKDKLAFPAKVDQDYFKGGCGALMLNIAVNTKNWYKREADLWAKFGNKFHSIGRNLIRGFGKGACGRQCVFVRQEDCLR